MSHQQINFMNNRKHCSSWEILGNWLRKVSDRIHDEPVPSYLKEQQTLQFLSKYLSFSGKRHLLLITEQDQITSCTEFNSYPFCDRNRYLCTQKKSIKTQPGYFILFEFRRSLWRTTTGPNVESSVCLKILTWRGFTFWLQF